MNFAAGKWSQESPNSQRSQRSPNSQESFNMSDIDDLLDLNKPPIFNSPKHSMWSGNYASQLTFSRSSQMTQSSGKKSNVDSGFDSMQSGSFLEKQPVSPLNAFGNVDTFSNRSIEPNDSAPSDANPKQDLLNASTFRNDDENGFDPNGNLEDSEMEGAIGFSQDSYFFTNSNSSSCSFNQRGIFSQPTTTSTSIESFDLSCDSPTLGSVDTTAQNDQCNEQVEETSMMNLEKPLSGSALPEIEPILKLFSKVKSQNTDCAFVSALASNMCKDIYPKHSNISLKTALLLSIVSCNNQSGALPISIMVISRDSAVVSSIMGAIGNLATRFICISDDLKFNGKCAQTTTIEANSLLMARNGICFIGDWMGLKPASLNYLRSVIDSGRVTCDSSSNIEYALMCAIWMYWTCSAKKMKQNQQHLSTISMLFGIPVVLDESPSQQVIDFIFDKYITKHVEDQQQTNDAEDDGIDDDTIKAFLHFVSQISTEFDEEALALLKYYFIVTRSIRPNILTPKSFDVLQRMSECHAQLCLRREVLKIDVLFSIELFEQFVLSVYAGEVPTKPMPNTSPNTLQQIDENMYEFAEWLEGYLSKFNDSVNSFFRE